MHCDADQQVFRIRLGILYEDVKISVGIKHARVDQFVLKFVSRPAAVFLHKITIGEFLLRILVEVFHVRVRGCAVKIEVVFLDVLAVVAFTIRQTEETLLKDWIPPIPKSDGEAELLLVIGNSSQTIFSPAVSPRTGLVMADVVPRVSVLAVVFPYRAPLSFAEIRPPFFPGDSVLTRLI